MKIFRIFSFVWLFVWTGVQSCWAFELTEWVIGSLSFQSMPGLGVGGGVSLGYSLGHSLIFEPALVYTMRNYSSIWGNGTQVNYSMPGVHIPLVLRYKLSDLSSIGVGFYLTKGSGGVMVKQNDQEQTLGYEQLQLERDDFGFVTSFQFKIPLNELMYLTFDERIIFGMKELDNSSNGSLKARDFQSWMGASFTL